MKTHSKTPCYSVLFCALVSLVVTGCQKPTAPLANPTPVTSPISIVEGETPSDEQKQSMLAAKDALFTTLSGRLMEAMQQQGPVGAIVVCQKEAPQMAANVGESHGLRIGRTGVRLRNSNNQPPTWAKSLTESQVDTPQFVKLSSGGAAALLPIKLQGQCLMCHGPQEQIASAVQDQLAKLYPDDRATGFREGELRGWFWIEMPAE